ncbi:hypothetical protein S40285_00480 [Stachybotrys chlorohalonatus IBT 40285]|uniref:Vps72/YL1 C-terminal domain-containing protein n=1 Tax=Stachybotrys chlorohalonatus (strain IBT 40285) TaxID=1283841 RepID=A0A084QN90_STAC4|nr:hypothetical protein S40285_00480 [Stachybotrys chlorohalonata IBT 40285]
MDSESKPSERDESRSSHLSSDSDSDSDSPASDAAAAATAPTEWLATTRQKRSTAGNRMKSMLANEDPDSDLELLFAEDENDQGFSDLDADGSDMHMDSSSDEEDDNNAADDLEGEKELEKQAKDRRAAQRKRKAQDAIPAKFRKKVRIDPTTPAAPAPRPKKKSERASWLPSPADLPTRASSRQTTRLSKESLHQQMVEREAKRLKQLAQMQSKAARLEALKKPPMTQEERLREAATVEKRNSKSLNRWEEAEKQREEERRAKLAALHRRTLNGPVLTFWSGIGNWVDDKLKLVGRHIAIEEQPKKRKREKLDKDKDKDGAKIKPDADSQSVAANENTTEQARETLDGAQVKPHDTPLPTDQPTAAGSPTSTQYTTHTLALAPADLETIPNPANRSSSPSLAPPPLATPAPKEVSGLAMPKPQQPPPPLTGLAAPAPSPLGSGQSPLMAPPVISRPMEPNSSGVLAAPMLAPPPGADRPANYAPPKFNVLAPPNMEHSSVAPPREATAPAAKPAPAQGNTALGKPPPEQVEELAKPDDAPQSEEAIDPNPPSRSHAITQNAIIYQNFDENAIKDKTIQTQILFGRKMNKLPKPAPAPLCVITNHPAKYRDPKTGLPYYNAYAYRQIQRLSQGQYKWSSVLGAWAGTGAAAARGVPERFLNPDAKKARAELEPHVAVKNPVPEELNSAPPPAAAASTGAAQQSREAGTVVPPAEAGQTTSAAAQPPTTASVAT